MAHEIRESSLILYNPAAKDPETLLAEFIDRKHLRARILDIIRHNSPDKSQQHVIVVGPRGMGKTTLLCAIRYCVQKDEVLSQSWLPLQFGEEQYGIGDLADFWLEALRHLEIELKITDSKVDPLLHTPSEELAQRAQDAFFELLKTSGKRALLLIDNINELFAAIDDGIALNRLRSLWMVDPRMMIVGATPSYFDEVTAIDQAFHDFFRVFHLDRLTQDELEAFLRHFATMRGDQQVIQVIEQEPQRVAAMRILTGGNPRLVMLGYRVLREGLDGDVRHDLERLLDECTPFFKHRIESLAKEARRTFDAIARHWDPVSVDDIRVELRKPSTYIRAQIKRLIAEGFIEEVSGEKKKRYQVSERFYNVYYLMRYSRESRRRLHWLVNFMQVFYTRKDYKYWAKRLGDELSQPLAESQRSEKLLMLQTMSLAADDGGRRAAFDAMVSDAIARNDRSILDADLAVGDPVERYGFRYFAVEILWLLQPADRNQLDYRPGSVGWWKKMYQMLLRKNRLDEITTYLRQSEHWHLDTARNAVAMGVIFGWCFDKLQEAEVAFRKAIELDSQYVIAWNGLGLALINQSRYKEAEAAYRKAIELDPQYVHAWNRLGNALNGQSRYQEAEAAYRKAIELDPQYIYALINLAGTCLFDLGKNEEGINLLLQGLSLDADDQYGRYVLRRSWREALPIAAEKIVANSNAVASVNLRKAITETLLAQAAGGKHHVVLKALLALDESAQQPFEVLILALQALHNRSLLQHIAREKRDVVRDIIASIAPEDGLRPDNQAQ